MALIILASLISLNAVYQFTGSFRPLRSFSFKSQLLSSIATTDTNVVLPGNRFRGTIAADFPAPLPRDYVLGLDSQKWEEIGLKSLQDGHLVQGGRWYSPLVTSTFKLPLGSLILVAASAISMVLSRFRVGLADTLAWVTGLSLVGLLCSQTGCNWAVRYILPALPLLFLAVGRVVQVAWGRRFWRWAVIACLVWNGIGLVRVHPFYLSYGNELVGGMDGAQRVFIGSNYDWGQDLGRLRRWLDEHADGRPVAVTYYGILDPEDVGIRNRGVPVEFWRSREAGAPQGPGYLREPFYWAISSNVLNGLPCWIKPDTGSGFEGTVHSPLLKPENAVARAGSSIYVFSIVPSGSGSATRPTLSSHDLSDCVVEYQAGPLEINATP
jgi:hypothetical protein